MADKKISDLTALTGANVADTDLLPIVDTSATETKKITFGEFKSALDTATGFVRITGDTMTGDLSFGDNDKAIFGAGSDLSIYHDGTASIIDETGTGPLKIRTESYVGIYNIAETETIATFAKDGAVRLYYDNGEKLATTATGISVTGDATFADNGKAIFGAGSDLQIYHDGSNSYIADTGTGGLRLLADADTAIRSADNSTPKAIFGGDVKLYHSGNLKIATTATGIDVNGTVVADGLTVDGNAVINGTNNVEYNSIVKAVANNGTVSTSLSFGGLSGSSNLKFYTSDSVLRQNISSGGNISFYEDTGTTAKFYWDSSAESLEIGSGASGILQGLIVNTANSVYTGTTDAGATLQLSDTSAGAGQGNFGPSIWFSGTVQPRALVGIRAKQTGTDSEHMGLSFFTHPGASASDPAVEQMVLAHSGNLGIGTSSPTATLDVNGTIKLDGNYPVGTSNVALGDAALDALTSGSYNTAIGTSALRANTTGINNTANGLQALFSNTTANSNTANGRQALYSNTTGASNTAVGYQSLRSNTTGINNTANGYAALYSNTTANSNTANGLQSLYFNTTGASNTANGLLALYSNTTGNYNTANGVQALYSNTTASNNTAVGYQAGNSNTTGDNLAAFGRQALSSNTTGADNTAIGDRAMDDNTTGSLNVAVGMNSLANNTSGNNNVAIGREALVLNTTASDNVAVGYQAGYNNTTGTRLVALGSGSLFSNTTGINNVALGHSALRLNTTGSSNIAIGYGTGVNVTTGLANTLVGNDWTGVWGGCGEAITTGSGNSFYGTGSGRLVTTGSKNTIIGGYSGNQGGLDIRTSSNNIVLSDGDGNPRVIVDSSGNVGIGTSSPSARLQIGGMAAGEQALLIESGRNDALSNGLVRINITDSVCPFAGLQIDHAGTGAAIIANGNVIVGKGGGTSNASQGVLITQTGEINAHKDSSHVLLIDRGTDDGSLVLLRRDGSTKGTISISGSTTSYNTSSDYRLKTDAQPMTGASDRVLSLKPVNFAWIADGTRVDGFLAHEAQEVVPEAVHGTKDAMRDEEYEVTAAVEATYDEDGNELTAAVPAVMGTRSVPDMQGIDQSKLVPLLTAALQEALTEISALKARVTALEGA